MKEIIFYDDPTCIMSEAYRSIRTNIEFSNIDEKLKTIVITSTKAGEGKSTTTANLGASFASINKKVLIVDCDLRRPRIHKIFEDTNVYGLTDILLGHKSVDECIISTDIKNLDILTTGSLPPNPSEVLTFDKMKRLIKSMKEKYDYIFVDAPPIGLVTDAGVVSTYTDGVILVVESGNIESNLAKEAKEKLDKVNANIVGVVLNKYKSEKRSSFYYYSETEEKNVLKKISKKIFKK